MRRNLDRVLVEATWGAWGERLRTALPPAPGELEAMARDGTTLRGSRQHGAPAAHVLAGLSHRLGLSVGQPAVADNTPESPVLADVWHGLGVEGGVITVAALRTPRAMADRIVHGGGDAVLLVPGHQPQLQPDLQLVFPEATAWAQILTATATVDRGHGRIAPRHLPASTALVGYWDGPGLAQVCPLERHVTRMPSGTQRHDVVSGVTSRGPGRAGPASVLGLVRQPWPLEHTVHGVREVTFDEARCHVRCGSMPQVMAAFRPTALGLRRWAGETTSAAACRRCAAPPWSALAPSRIILENSMALEVPAEIPTKVHP